MATPMVLANWLSSGRLCPKASVYGQSQDISVFNVMKLLVKLEGRVYARNVKLGENLAVKWHDGANDQMC